MRWSTVVRVAVVLSCGVASSTARADALSEARDLHRQALALYDLGRFAEAAQKIEAAFLLRDDSDLLLDAGLAWRRAGNDAAALRVYRGYLRRAQAGSPMIDAISECIDELQAKRKQPRGCPREPARISWTTATTTATATAPTPATTPTATPRAPIADDEYEPPPSRRSAPPSADPSAAPPTPTPTPRGPTIEAAPSVTVYDPWNKRITHAGPSRIAPMPPAPTPREPPREAPLVVEREPPPPRRPSPPAYKTAWFWATMVLVAGTIVGVGVGVSYAVPNNASSTLPTYDVGF